LSDEILDTAIELALIFKTGPGEFLRMPRAPLIRLFNRAMTILEQRAEEPSDG